MTEHEQAFCLVSLVEIIFTVAFHLALRRSVKFMLRDRDLCYNTFIDKCVAPFLI